jgi:two-component system sensor kinase
MERSSRQLQGILQHSPDLISVFDRDGRYLLVNEALAELYELRPEDIEGRTFRDFLPPEVIEVFFSRIQQVDKEKKPVRVEDRIPTADGVRVFETRLFKITNRESEAYCGIATDVTDRTTAEERLREALVEREVLLREVHHRVKNNMQVISSLLRLGLGQEDERLQGMVVQAQARIRSMALVHEQLYQTNDLSNVDIRSYVLRLWEICRNNYGEPDLRPQLSIEGAELKVDAEIAVPLGLIMHELLANAMEHAFVDSVDQPIVSVVLSRVGRRYQVVVADNGLGFPPASERHGMGMTIVQALVQQIHGDLAIQNADGARVTVSWESEEA